MTIVFLGIPIHPSVTATNHIQEVCEKCALLLPVISSIHFRKVIRQMSPYLGPEHMMVHGTKGFDLLPGEQEKGYKYEGFRRRDVKTMSEIIIEEDRCYPSGSIMWSQSCRRDS